MNTAKPRFTERGRTGRVKQESPLESCYMKINGRKYVADGISEEDALLSCFLLMSNTRTREYKHGKGEFYEEKIM